MPWTIDGTIPTADGAPGGYTIDGTGGSGGGSAPVITLNPSNVTIDSGATATFTATASGSPAPTWQWQISTDSGGTWSNVIGATSASYTTPVETLGANADQFRAVATNSNGSATTTAAILTVLNVGVPMGNTNTVPQALFGPGVMIMTRTDGGDKTPFNVGYVNELSLDWGFDTKQLKGQFQFPLLVARGTAKTSGKVKAATASGRALNTLIYGGTWTTGTQYGLTQTAATAIPGTPFTITPPPPNTGTWNGDCGVVNAATGEPLELVTGTVLAGQYSVSAGVYTFSSADNLSGVSVKISIVYTWTTGSAGQYQFINNALIGTTPTFQVDYSTILYGAEYFVRLFACVGGKASEAHKIDDFAMPEYDFEFFANSAQEIGIVSMATTA